MESVPPSQRENMECLPNWSALNRDLLVEIVVCIPLMEDFMAFRGVCSSWRTAATKNKFKPSSPRVPLLMLPEKEDSDDREFYSLSKKKICMRLSLPQLKGRKCVEVRFGWILTLASSGEVSLLNPLSGAQIEVPNYRSFPYSQADVLGTDPAVDTYDFTRRAILSANPSDTSNFVLMVLLDASRCLGIWRSGEKSWMELKPLQEFDDITCHNDKFYGFRSGDHFDFEAWVWVWDPFGSDLLTSFVMRTGFPYGVCFWFPSRLVESSDGKLLLITRCCDVDGVSRQFGVAVFDVLKRQWGTISCDLEDDAVFLGRNAYASVAASAFPDAVKPNCIYITPDGWDDTVKTGVFSFENWDFEPLDLGGNEDSESLWIAPSS